MEISLYLAVAQWTLLFGFAFLVIMLYRQLGHVFGAKAPFKHGPPAGTRAESFEYKRVSDHTLQYVAPGGGQPALLAFVNPTCQACEELVRALSAAHKSGDLKDLRVLLLISEPATYLQISDAFRATDLEIGQILSKAPLNSYKVTATPLVIAIDAGGVIGASGAATELAEVRGFIRACFVPHHEPHFPDLPVVQKADAAH
jgi:hypothetical protein